MANQATRDLAEKLRLEPAFRKAVRTGFNKELVIFRKQVLMNGRIMNPEEIRQLWLEIVGKQYRRVVPAFSSAEGLDPLSRDILEANLERFTIQSVVRDSGFIARTSEKDMLIARNEAIKFLRENDVAITERSLGRVGSRILRRLQSPRVENIVVTETQSAAEGSKELTNRVEQKNRKQWITVSDSKVRPAHVAAHGQFKLMDQPFIVGGQPLKYPGDTSLGASVGNVAFCRCAAIYG